MFSQNPTRRVLVIGGGVLVAVILAVAAFFVLTNRSPHTPTPTPPAFVKEGDPTDCTGGFMIDIQETTLFRPGIRIDGPAYTTSGVRIEHGIMKANLSGDELDSDLNVGESVVADGVGMFTLLDVTPRDPSTDGMVGGGGTATFCFQPDPAFDVDPSFF